ncbi:YfhJ family protein [Halalkalibacter lacteus]|uniref:YfhJ family protein n=1 Tax=Halalkalibacter lacteus TaxID=3090663 RepID=UPI002FC634F4
MEDRFQRLTEQLLSINSNITVTQARTWVESLWEDFETTRAKGGWSYKGQDATEKIVVKWIEQYGPFLHKYASNKEKFSHLNQDDQRKH